MREIRTSEADKTMTPPPTPREPRARQALRPRASKHKEQVQQTHFFIDDSDSQGDDGKNTHDPGPDLTSTVAIRSKRTERRQKKLQKKALQDARHHMQCRGLADLPFEMLMAILVLLTPRDVFAISRLNRGFRQFVKEHEAYITHAIVSLRYSVLAQCFPLPVLQSELLPEQLAALESRDWFKAAMSQKRHFQHIQLNDPALTCTCLTCVLRWNCLCIIVDFAHWQDKLDTGEPIPTIPHGRSPEWNQDLVARNSRVVIEALKSPLWHARILEAHLSSTVRSIRRHTQNKGNQRPHFVMTEADVRAGTDTFLSRKGPPTVEFPYQRDNYYMLEAYLPNRSWIDHRGGWVYLPLSQHDTEIEVMRKTWVSRGIIGRLNGRFGA